MGFLGSSGWNEHFRDEAAASVSSSGYTKCFEYFSSHRHRRTLARAPLESNKDRRGL